LIYCIDTCSLIDLGERRYPESISVFKPIWDHLYSSIQDGTLVSVDMVQIELEQRADAWRTAFISQASSMFQISESIEQEFNLVVSEIESNPIFSANRKRDRFMSGADPWLIALARSYENATVISSETKNLANYGLGEVCDVLGVSNISLLDYINISQIQP